MARAQFHKNQRVYVRPVGTWALIERVVPQWTKGLEEPIRIFYDVGLGREFGVDELQSEANGAGPAEGEEQWRIIRAPNKWQSSAETMHHPYPGTYPTIVTGDADWGGWRVPGAEYALSPIRVERQARMIAMAPRLAAIAEQLVRWAKETGDAPDALTDILTRSAGMHSYLNEDMD